MSESRPRIARIILIGAALIVLAYGLFEARRYLQGPVLVIESPAPHSTLSGPSIRVEGYGHNLSYLYINGAQAYLNEEGHLSWVYSAPRGYTILTARGEDRFGRSREVSIPFIVK